MRKKLNLLVTFECRCKLTDAHLNNAYKDFLLQYIAPCYKIKNPQVIYLGVYSFFINKYYLPNPTGLPTRVIAQRKPNQSVDCS